MKITSNDMELTLDKKFSHSLFLESSKRGIPILKFLESCYWDGLETLVEIEMEGKE